MATGPMTGQGFKIAWRIKTRQYESDAQFNRLLALFAAYREVVDEVALFVGDVDTWHGYDPLEDFAVKAQLAGKRLKQLKESRVPFVGINIWPTFGSEDAPGAELRPALPFQAMVGFNGKVARSTACIQTPEFIAYIRKRFALAAEQHPDFIWVDDDCRMTHLGVPYPCFCPTCLSLFDNGRWQRREDLVTALNEPANAELRQKKIEFNTASLEKLCTEIQDAIHQVDAAIDVGWMTVGPTHSTYSGRYIHRCGIALGGRRGRAGHGFYWDDRPRDLVSKTLEVGRQIVEYPANIVDIQYEFEDHPSIMLDKSLQTIANEITLAAAIGCTGVAMNTLHFGVGDLAEYAPVLARIKSDQPAWNLLVRESKDLPLVGLWPAATPLLTARRAVDKLGWFNEEDPRYNIAAPNQWAEMGLAFTPDPTSACGTLLAGRVAEAFSDDELRSMLSGAVFMDADALQVLETRGLGYLAGVALGSETRGVFERQTAHPVNGSYAGDERQTWFEGGWGLKLLSRETQVASELFQVDGKSCGPCVTLFTNRLGGRVVVMSYAPWVRVGRASKLFQIKSLVDWATGRKQPLYFEANVRVTPLVRMNTAHTRLTAVLLNNTFDPLVPLRFSVRAQIKQVWQVTASGEKKALPVQPDADGIKVTLAELPAWQTVTLLGE